MSAATLSHLPPKIRRAVRAYGVEVCATAYDRYTRRVGGASTIGMELGLTTRQADAAINAGRFLAGEA
jgi:hypothetical protein